MAQTRAKTIGRGKTATFLALPKHIVDSDEYAKLTAFEVKLLVDLFAQFNGFNNGDLCAAWGVMNNKGWRSRDTLFRAIEGLRYSGFIMRTRQGGRNKASLYAVTWLSIDECKRKLDVQQTRVPSNEWRK